RSDRPHRRRVALELPTFFPGPHGLEVRDDEPSALRRDERIGARGLQVASRGQAELAQGIAIALIDLVATRSNAREQQTEAFAFEPSDATAKLGDLGVDRLDLERRHGAPPFAEAETKRSATAGSSLLGGPSAPLPAEATAPSRMADRCARRGARAARACSCP